MRTTKKKLKLMKRITLLLFCSSLVIGACSKPQVSNDVVTMKIDTMLTENPDFEPMFLEGYDTTIFVNGVIKSQTHHTELFR